LPAGGQWYGLSRETTTGVKIESTRERLDPTAVPSTPKPTVSKPPAPAVVTDRVEKYLAPGEYDAVEAARIDYDAVESIMTDWLAGGGKITSFRPAHRRPVRRAAAGAAERAAGDGEEQQH
jgi:hypothetical protein